MNRPPGGLRKSPGEGSRVLAGLSPVVLVPHFPQDSPGVLTYVKIRRWTNRLLQGETASGGTRFLHAEWQTRRREAGPTSASLRRVVPVLRSLLAPARRPAGRNRICSTA